MLKKLTVKGFKSLANVTVDFAPFTVVYGGTATGKTNLIHALHVFSKLATLPIAPALANSMYARTDPTHGYPRDVFTLPRGGLSELFDQEAVQFSMEAELTAGQKRYRYRVVVQMCPISGKLTIADEYLTLLDNKGEPKGYPIIEKIESNIHIRRTEKETCLQKEPIGQDHTILSAWNYNMPSYRCIETVRKELSNWCPYCLDTRVAMRKSAILFDVSDIGLAGENIAAFLYRLEKPTCLNSISQQVQSILANVEAIDVDRNPHTGMLDLMIRQDGIDYPARLVSDGTLWVIGLCAIAANPWSGSVIMFDELGAGLDSRLTDDIVSLFCSLVTQQDRQVIVTTNSSQLCDELVNQSRCEAESILIRMASAVL